MKTAGQDIRRDLLPVLDDIERAEKSVSSATDVEAVKEGFQLIKEKLFKNLSAKGLKAMESKGEPFNADFHEAVTEIPAPVEELKGKVVDEIEKGYLLNEKIIRYAKVVVGK
jgi:molecular chaperone GrpE